MSQEGLTCRDCRFYQHYGGELFTQNEVMCCSRPPADGFLRQGNVTPCLWFLSTFSSGWNYSDFALRKTAEFLKAMRGEKG